MADREPRDAETKVRRAAAQRLKSESSLGAKEIPVKRRKANATVARPPESGRRIAPTTRQASPGARTAPAAARGRTSVAASGENAARLRVLDEQQVKGCRKCALSQGRTNTVFGQGDPHAQLVFVGEAPGFEEDRQGLAFVGKAGQLLTKMIEAMGITRDDVFICNVLKCRPPNNRDPAADEIAACSPYLFEQLSIIRPRVIVALGSPASKTLLNTSESIGRLRGRFHEFFTSGVAGVGDPTPLMPTYHPAYLLRSPGEKGKSWDDLQKVMKLLGLKRPTRPAD